MHILLSRILCSLAVWWTVGMRPEGCTLPWTTFCHAVLFLISWHFCLSCLRLEPYMGIIQHSQCAISLNYICLVVAFTFHCEINCVSMAAPPRLHNGMHYCSPSSYDIDRSQRETKCMAMLQTAPFPLQLYFYSKVTISRHKHWGEHCEIHYSTKHLHNKNSPIWINSKYFYDSRCYYWVQKCRVWEYHTYIAAAFLLVLALHSLELTQS